MGEDQEESVVKVHARLMSAMDAAPPGALPPLSSEQMAAARAVYDRYLRAAIQPRW